MEHRDEIDKWLYEELQLIPGSCSSISALQYNTARMVAEKLWLKWEDMKRIYEIIDGIDSDGDSTWNRGIKEYFTEVLDRFLKSKEK